jgi:hypothetical protein
MSAGHLKQDICSAVFPFLSSMFTFDPLLINIFTIVSLSSNVSENEKFYFETRHSEEA